MVIVWNAVGIVFVGVGVGVGTVVRMPPLGRLVTVLLRLKVMNSCDSATMKRVQLPPMSQTDRPAVTIRMVMKEFGGMPGGRGPSQSFEFVSTEC